MSDDRTPTTEEIRRWCIDDGGLAEYHDPINGHLLAKQTAAAFDRWLVAHDATTRAQSWDEGHETWWERGPDGCDCDVTRWEDCSCFLYGTGDLLSLAQNPYRKDAT